jgi:hypothetical protein
LKHIAPLAQPGNRVIPACLSRDYALLGLLHSMNSPILPLL